MLTTNFVSFSLSWNLLLEMDKEAKPDRVRRTYTELYGIFGRFQAHVYHLLGEVDVQNIDRSLFVLPG